MYYTNTNINKQITLIVYMKSLLIIFNYKYKVYIIILINNYHHISQKCDNS